jgi:hypothetical protein
LNTFSHPPLMLRRSASILTPSTEPTLMQKAVALSSVP